MSGEVSQTVRFEEVGTTLGEGIPVIALRGGRCQRTKHDGERCALQARFFRVTDADVVIGVCGHPHHRPDEDEDGWIDALDHECDKYVVHEREGDPTFGRGGREVEMDERVTECGNQAAVLIDRLDSGVTVRCRRHARRSWLDKLERVERDDEGESEAAAEAAT